MSRVVCEFTYDGPGVAKGRPRATTVGGKARMYTPDRTSKFEVAFGLHAKMAVAARGPMAAADEAVRLTVRLHRAMPASWSKRKRAAMNGRLIIGRPDFDNVLKAISDAMNGVAYVDDAQIASLRPDRFWGVADEIEVLVTVPEDPA